jgi:dTDP-4-dehydrorhamnose reductase
MIYLLGGTGYVGRAYQRLFLKRGLPFKCVRRSELDYTDSTMLLQALRVDRPKFLINAAGYTGKPTVDACESNKAACLFANAILPSRIGNACTEAGIPWAHVSSGCIYSGTKSANIGYAETDTPNFTFRDLQYSFYSGSKALGEELLAGLPNMYIWRLRMPFDHIEDNRNYLSKLMFYPKLLEATNSLSELQEFTAATLASWEKQIPFGTYHVTNPGIVSTREIVELIKLSGLCKKQFSFFANELEFMQTTTRTPRSNCILDSTKLRGFGINLTEVHDAISRNLSNWKKSAR